MKAAKAAQMRAIDSHAIQHYGIPGIVLMENAAIKVWGHVMAALKEYRGNRVCIVCGKGNNGGDGFALARQLLTSGIEVKVYLVGTDKDIKGDALINYNILKNMGTVIYPIIDEKGLEILCDHIKGCSVLVDALLGTGTRGEVAGLFRDVIDIINEHASYVISVDIPSGIDADTGRVLGIGVKADKTVTFVIPKIGLCTYPGATYVGQLAVEDISISFEAVEKQGISVNLLTGEYIAGLLPVRRRDTNKGSYGRALIVGGSASMMGAPVMCGLSALKSGTGIVEVCVPKSIQPRAASVMMEAIVEGLDENQGTIAYGSLGKIKELIKKASGFAFGPGLSKSDELRRLLEGVLEGAAIPCVIDADGLNLLSIDKDILFKAGCPVIITPHPGEMSRLTGYSIEHIQNNRISCAVEFSVKYNVITVLKSANTIIASPNGEVFINPTGNPGMAKGGAGDVLTGIIVSLIAQRLNPLDAVLGAVYIHGLAGDMASGKIGEYGMKAGDIIDFIPFAIKSVMEQKVITRR